MWVVLGPVFGATVTGALAFVVARWVAGGPDAGRRRAVLDWLQIVRDADPSWPETSQARERVKAEMRLLLGVEDDATGVAPVDDPEPRVFPLSRRTLLMSFGIGVAGAAWVGLQSLEEGRLVVAMASAMSFVLFWVASLISLSLAQGMSARDKWAARQAKRAVAAEEALQEKEALEREGDAEG